MIIQKIINGINEIEGKIDIVSERQIRNRSKDTQNEILSFMTKKEVEESTLFNSVIRCEYIVRNKDLCPIYVCKGETDSKSIRLYNLEGILLGKVVLDSWILNKFTFTIQFNGWKRIRVKRTYNLLIQKTCFEVLGSEWAIQQELLYGYKVINGEKIVGIIKGTINGDITVEFADPSHEKQMIALVMIILMDDMFEAWRRPHGE